MDNGPRTTDLRAIAPLLLAACLAGCGTPSGANIELRKQNQDLREQIEKLNRQHEADAASLRAAEARGAGGSTLPTLPTDRLAGLFTTHGIALGVLTGGWDADPAKPGDEGVKVQLTPQDEDGQKLKAAGAVTVDVFDLALADDNHIGHWDVAAADARKAWLGAAMQYNYLLKLPWQRPPAHAELTLKVTFTDALTGRAFTAQKVITVAPPAR